MISRTSRLPSPAAWAIALLSLRSLVSAQRLDKPVMEPSFELNSLDQGLLDNLSPTASTFDAWGADWIPAKCKETVERRGLSANDVEVFNVHYNDCNEPWIMCRHNQAPMSRLDMIDLFGRMPVRMRSFVRHLTALPLESPGDTPSASTSEDNISFIGLATSISVVVHEIAHSIDSNAFAKENRPALMGLAPFHGSTPWLDAYNADSRISDDYAGTSQAENFAQQTVIALFDMVVPGGIASFRPDSEAMFTQYTTVQNYIGSTLTPGSICPGRLENSEPVLKSGPAARLRFRSAPSPKPDVSLGKEVTVIPSNGESIEYDSKL